MSKQACASLTINALEMNWDEDSRRVLKPCFECQKPTKGRAWGSGGIKKPACISHALGSAIDTALKVYRPTPTTTEKKGE